jgi:hypothetical protein
MKRPSKIPAFRGHREAASTCRRVPGAQRGERNISLVNIIKLTRALFNREDR